MVMCQTERMWDALCIAMERSDLPLDQRFETDAPRVENAEALSAELGLWMLERTKHEVIQTLGAAGVPCGATLDTQDLFADPHLRERGFVQTLDHPVHGPIEVLVWAPRMSASAVLIIRAPPLGEHSDEELCADLGCGDAEIAELRRSGLVG